MPQRGEDVRGPLPKDTSNFELNSDTKIMETEDHDSQGRVVEEVAVKVVREEGELQGQVARLLAVLP